MRVCLIFFFFMVLACVNAEAGLEDEIKYLFPDAENGLEYTLQDDSNGKGPYIKEWRRQDRKPTKAELEAVTVQATQAAVDRRKGARLSRAIYRVVIKFLANHHGMTEKQVRDELKSYME